MKLGTQSSPTLATIVPTGATIFTVAGLIIYRWWRDRNGPPQFRMGLPLLGPIIQFLKDPLELIRRGYKKHGGCFQVNLIGKDMTFLVGQQGQEFFFTKDKILDQAKMYSFTIPIFGQGVLYDTDLTTRLAQMHLISDRLSHTSMAAYVSTLEKEVIQFFDEQWPENEGFVDIRSSMIECLTRTSIQCLMGPELRSMMHAGGKHRSVCEMLHTLEQGMLPLSVFMPNAPIPRHRARDAARAEMAELLSPILAERRRKVEAGESTDTDLLWKLMRSTYPDGRKITDNEAVGFIIAAFFGGMHNSSITTAWSTLEITTRPDLVSELLAEQREVLGGDEKAFTFGGYEKMKKLRSSIMETLRLHPPLMLLMRTVEADATFQQYTIRKGSVVACSPNVAGMLEEDFPSPNDFNPSRFENGAPNQFAYIPFGGGRRLCKGQEFGFLQISCVISYMLRHFELQALDGVTPPTIGEGMVIAPSQPCRVQYKRKTPKAKALSVPSSWQKGGC